LKYPEKKYSRDPISSNQSIDVFTSRPVHRRASEEERNSKLLFDRKHRNSTYKQLDRPLMIKSEYLRQEYFYLPKEVNHH
jgi:hypothetical protein